MLMTALSELLIVVALDRPFSGTVKVGPDAIADVIADHAGGGAGKSKLQKPRLFAEPDVTTLVRSPH
jgi:hypothetical protein